MTPKTVDARMFSSQREADTQDLGGLSLRHTQFWNAKVHATMCTGHTCVTPIPQDMTIITHSPGCPTTLSLTTLAPHQQ